MSQSNGGMELPGDTEIPVFVYGFLKPGEISYAIVEPYVEFSRPAQVNGVLWVRDGLPLLNLQAERSVEGYLLFPKPRLYEVLCGFEPCKQYRWTLITTEDGIYANVLIGVKADKGSIRYERESFTSRDDILLVEGPRAVRATLDRSRSEDEIAAFFELQMAYLLLWSIIERFMSLRYGPWLEALEKIKRLGEDAIWREALESIAPLIEIPRQPVIDSRNPDTSYRLTCEKPLKSLLYYYQFRCNITHRGKAAIMETDRLRDAATLLMDCVQSLWQSSGIEWKGATSHRATEFGRL